MNTRRFVVTGATSGIGLETARALAGEGAEVILACRNSEKADRVRSALVTETGNQRITTETVDLSSFASVRAFAARMEAIHNSVDVLINNAGTFSMTRGESEDGLELTLATNHLGPFLLTHLLLPLLRNGRAPRIVNVASDAYKYGKLRYNDLQMARRYGGFRAYAASRLATVLFTQELAVRPEGNGITVHSCHPGHVNTGIWPHTTGLLKVAMELSARFRISAAQGAAPVVRLATADDPGADSGTYFDRLTPVMLKPRFTDRIARQQLWDESCRLTGLARGEQVQAERPEPLSPGPR